jgi:molybdopterin-guanine dinucleotide biosynthesis protein A
MGQDKALLPLNGQPMIQHIAATMQSVVAPVCIVSDRTEPYRFLNLPVIPDLVKDAGPIGGIHAALTTLGAPAVLTAGCDTPFLSTPLFRHLLNAPHTSPALVARADNGLHPLCAVYRREALPLIEQFLRAGRFKLLDLLDELGADIIDISPDLPFYRSDLFVNVNDPSAHLRLNGTDTPGNRR